MPRSASWSSGRVCHTGELSHHRVPEISKTSAPLSVIVDENLGGSRDGRGERRHLWVRLGLPLCRSGSNGPVDPGDDLYEDGASIGEDSLAVHPVV